MTEGPIIIVEDDKDDRVLYEEAIRAIGIFSELRFFDGGQSALDYLTITEEQPFIILSDVNMPGMTGLQLKKHMQEDPYLAAKGIPFVFIATDASKVAIRHAHALSVQGYFQKPNSKEAFKDMLRTLFTCWILCKHINNT